MRWKCTGFFVFSLILVPMVVLMAFDHPIEFQVVKMFGDNYSLKIHYPDNFGVQKEAPNKIMLSGSDGLQVVGADLKIQGETSKKKKEYFAKLNDMTIQLKGSGKLHIHAKIFYCDFHKNICIPGRLNVVKEIP